MQAIKVYNLREVDELVFLDVTATPAGPQPDFELVDDLADDCFMPLTVGGGVARSTTSAACSRSAPTRSSISTAAVEDPDLVREARRSASASQCVVVSIDVRRDADGTADGVDARRARADRPRPVDVAQELEALGRGRDPAQSIDRDGTMEGYDLELIRRVSRAVTVPVIASGGAGSLKTWAGRAEGGASAVAAASIFHFTEQTPPRPSGTSRRSASRFACDPGFLLPLADLEVGAQCRAKAREDGVGSTLTRPPGQSPDAAADADLDPPEGVAAAPDDPGPGGTVQGLTDGQHEIGGAEPDRVDVVAQRPRSSRCRRWLWWRARGQTIVPAGVPARPQLASPAMTTASISRQPATRGSGTAATMRLTRSRSAAVSTVHRWAPHGPADRSVASPNRSGRRYTNGHDVLALGPVGGLGRRRPRAPDAVTTSTSSPTGKVRGRMLDV